MKKVILINNIISPVCVHICDNLNNYYKKNGIDFKVLFLSVSDKNRNWKADFDMKFDYEILDNFAIRITGKDLNTFFINTSIIKYLNDENPNRIICFGWDHFAAYASNWWCERNKKEFTLWSGSTKYEKSWRRTLLKPMVKYILKRTDNFIAYGTRAKNYLISLDAPKEKIKIIFHNVDIDKFSQESENFSRKEKNKLKEKLGIKTNKIILFSGQLIERKGIFELLNGFNNYTKLDSNVSLLVLGQGREKEKMEEIIRNKNIQNVFFTGFIQYNELYKFYSISDLFILPSREEVWGLAINEAMACGLPIITTHETGASVDLIEEGKNGYIIPSNNSKAITQAIQKVFQNNLHKKNNSWQIVQKTRVEDVLKKVKI